MTWKLYVFMSGGGALAAYALSSTAPFTPPAHVAEPRVVAAPQAAAVDIGALADGLRERMAVERGYRAPARDAFSFAEAPSASLVPAPVEAPPPIALPPPPPMPPFGLFGVMAGDGTGAATAMLSSLGGITFASKGDTVGGWRVVEIAQSAVTLESVVDGTRTTLHLFGPGSP